MPNQRVCDFADPPTEEEGGGNPKKVAQCKRVKFGGRRAGPTRQYNSRGVQWGANPAIKVGCSYFWVGKNRKTTGQFDEIGGLLVPGAVNDTKKIRKAGGEIFANVRPEKQEQ